MKKRKMTRKQVEDLKEKMLLKFAAGTTFFALGMLVQRIATEGISWMSTIGYFR